MTFCTDSRDIYNGAGSSALDRPVPSCLDARKCPLHMIMMTQTVIVALALHLDVASKLQIMDITVV